MALRILPPPRASLAASRIVSFGITPRISNRPRLFFTLPSSSPSTQTLTATRTLPYSSAPLYDLIADVDSYVQFVPYCSQSRVTRWSEPDAAGRRFPTLADLRVGWGGFDEVFTSRLRCVPGVSVEAVSGSTQSGSGDSDASVVFRSLVTRWSVKELANLPSPSTEVHLTIDFQFTNPLYAAVSAAVSDKVAALMIEAFEKQAHQKLRPERNL